MLEYAYDPLGNLADATYPARDGSARGRAGHAVRRTLATGFGSCPRRGRS